METRQQNEGLFSLPIHTTQAVVALFYLLLFSTAMFTLPIAAYYYTGQLLSKSFHINGFTNTVWSVVAAVFVVNLIIIGYALKGFYEKEYDDDGNEIDQNKPPQSKLQMNLKKTE